MESKIYLSKPNLDLIGTLNGIKKDTINLKIHATDIWEMSFEIDKYINDNSTGKLIQSDYYEAVNSGMKLYLDNKKYPSYFIIDKEPTITIDGNTETKSVTCHSCECELQNIYLTLQINTGIKNISAEYLADDNIDDYTGLPKQYVSLINYNNHQLSLLHLVLEKTGWKVADNINEEICNRVYSFNIDNSDIHSFLTQSLANTSQCIIDFDKKNKTVKLIDKENYGVDTGIFLSYRNLLNKLDKSPINENLLITKYYPTGKDGLGIFYANFGQDFLVDFDYYANAKDEYGNYKFLSKELSEKYNKYIDDTDHEKVEYIGKEYTRRELYIELSRRYNSLQKEKTELINRVPNDGCEIDYTTYKYDELIISLKAYNNALLSLITLYKNEFDVDSIGDAPDYLPQPSDKTNIKDTVYWYDFAAYKETILPKVYEALKIWCKTNNKGDLCDKNGVSLTVINEETLVPYNNGMTTNPLYSDTLLKNIDSYLYDFSLYGLDELNAKRISWLTVVDTLYTDGFILNYDNNNNPVYNTPDAEGWNRLGDKKKNFTNLLNYTDKLNTYLDYVSFSERDNNITGKYEKGIIRQCEDKIKELESKIGIIDNSMEEIDELRKKLSSKYTFHNYFTEEEKKIFTILTREGEYSNENIITTNLDDIVTLVDKQNELYQDAKDKLYIESHPQWHFDINSDNLFDIDEMNNMTHDFTIGNFIRVQTNLYKDEFVKLRLISIEMNPCDISDKLDITFSDMAYTYNKVNDFNYMFSKLYRGSSSTSSSSGSSSNSSSNSNGKYGDNDAGIQISNNVLNALLSSEKFGTSVTDVVLDSLVSNKGNFQDMLVGNLMANSVSVGKTVIDGECLTVGQIKSLNYNGTLKNGVYQIDNTSGSILNLDDGKFNFAGGKLKWDKDVLSVEGNITANSLILKPNASISGISSSNLSDSDKIIFKDSGIGNPKNDHSNNYIKISSNGLLEADNAIIHGIIYANEGIFNGEIIAKTGNIGGYTIGEYNLTGNNVGISSLSGHGYAFWAGNNDSTKAPFRVGHAGELYASNATITGLITGSTITGGNITGTTINGGSINIGDGNFTVESNGNVYAHSLTFNAENFEVIVPDPSKDWRYPIVRIDMITGQLVMYQSL